MAKTREKELPKQGNVVTPQRPEFEEFLRTAKDIEDAVMGVEPEIDPAIEVERAITSYDANVDRSRWLRRLHAALADCEVSGLSLTLRTDTLLPADSGTVPLVLPMTRLSPASQTEVMNALIDSVQDYYAQALQNVQSAISMILEEEYEEEMEEEE